MYRPLWKPLAILFCAQKQSVVSLNGLRFRPSKQSYDQSLQGQHYDVAIIGGGSGGISCALQCAQEGLSVVIFDYVHPSQQNSTWGLGGTCLNVGCIPKKLMHTAALHRASLEAMSSYGIQVEYKDISWTTLKDNIQNYIRSMSYSYKSALGESCTYANQMAVFESRSTNGIITLQYSGSRAGLEKEEQRGRVTADQVVVAVGGRPNYLEEEVCQGAAQYCISSDDLFSRTQPPGESLVIGGGYIAVESAGLLAGLGYPVDLMTRGEFLRSFDRQTVAYLLEGLSNHNVNIMGGHLPYSIEKKEQKYIVKYKNTSTGETYHKTYDTVMMAVGRQSAVPYIYPERVGLELGKYNKVKSRVGETEGTNIDNIYSVGDANEQSPELQPIASQSGKQLGERLALLKRGVDRHSQEYHNRLFDSNDYPTTIFSPIEYSVVGRSEEQAVSQYGHDQVECYLLKQNRLEDSIGTQNIPGVFYKVVVHKQNQRVLGLHYLGAHAGEVMQGLAIAYKKGITKQELDQAVAIHPTSAEGFTKVDITKSSGVPYEKSGC